jgi:CO dehydrogenase maturation factor
VLIVNQVKEGQMQAVEQAVEEYKLALVGTVPDDPEVTAFDLEGRPTIELENGSEAVSASYDIFARIIPS